MEVKLSDLKIIYDEEIKKNVKNKRKIFFFERYKMEYLNDIKNCMEENRYNGGRYSIFLVFKPKLRVVMSQNIYDKIINHYVARFILMPKLEKYLSPYNCATRKNMGTSYALKLFKSTFERYKKQGTFYYLKLDIKKYFYTIDHNIILKLVEKDLDKDEYELLKVILASTNNDYVNEFIKHFSMLHNIELPLYEKDKGLPIGNMTSQFLAIFYLSNLHYYMKHNLQLDFVNYMDDYIVFSKDKAYLKECYQKIKQIIERDYNLRVNEKKTYIAKSTSSITFLGHTFRVNPVNNRTIIKMTKLSRQNIINGIKEKKHLYEKGKINLNALFCSIENHKHSHIFVKDYSIENILNKYWER